MSNSSFGICSTFRKRLPDMSVEQPKRDMDLWDSLQQERNLQRFKAKHVIERRKRNALRRACFRPGDGSSSSASARRMRMNRYEKARSRSEGNGRRFVVKWTGTAERDKYRSENERSEAHRKAIERLELQSQRLQKLTERRSQGDYGSTRLEDSSQPSDVTFGTYFLLLRRLVQ